MPAAVEIQDWICEEVIPSIRETGTYSVKDKPLSAKEVSAIVHRFVELEKKIEKNKSVMIDLSDRFLTPSEKFREISKTTQLEKDIIVRQHYRSHRRRIYENIQQSVLDLQILERAEEIAAEAEEGIVLSETEEESE
jgi:hypothetical protein